MIFITDEIMAEAVRLQEDNIFDSHDFFAVIMREWPQEYTRELYEFSDMPDPFVSLHTQLAQALARLERLVSKRGKVQSVNCRGQISPCESWSRLG